MDKIETLADRTICNPLNLNYRFQIDKPSRREAADPTVVSINGEYFLFASKSEGYWYSSNLTDWTFVQTNQIPVEEYAPTVVVIQGVIYYLASSTEKSTIYKSINLKSGIWEKVVTLSFAVWDPNFLYDNGRLYMYWGSSDVTPIYGIELSADGHFNIIGKRFVCIEKNPVEHGWECSGDHNEESKAPWIEGAWMTTYNGKYYLLYSGPGTEFKTYAYGVYESNTPLGPFTYANHNPIASKPWGFIGGAGHGSLFKDHYGNYWLAGTMVISIKHIFERRLGLFPAFFDHDNLLYTYTGHGDYPFIIPNKKIEHYSELITGWNLLSYNKPIKVSSAVKGHKKEYATDEDIKTYWCAATGDATEWISIDLQSISVIYAVQLNFAEHDTHLYARQLNIYYQYELEFSCDGIHWKTLIDKSNSKQDTPHDYHQLSKAIKARFLKLKNRSVPDGKFALSGFRVFGKGMGSPPENVKEICIKRDPSDLRKVALKWHKVKDADGYLINYGMEKNKLYLHHRVYGTNRLILRGLNKNSSYWFTIKSFNKNGESAESKALKIV